MHSVDQMPNMSNSWTNGLEAFLDALHRILCFRPNQNTQISSNSFLPNYVLRKPSTWRCADHSTGKAYRNLAKVMWADCRPSKILSTISGARKAHWRTRLTYRSSRPVARAIDHAPLNSPRRIR